MNYKIVEKESFNIIGKGIFVSTVNEEDKQKITQFWAESTQNGFTHELSQKSGPMGLLGVCMITDSSSNGFTYIIGVEKTSNEKVAEWDENVIPAATWAVFEVVGPLPVSIQKMWERIFTEWFPSSGYAHAKAPQMEVYLDGDVTAEDYVCEIWIPIIKK